MKKKILALAFVAAMTLGLAKTANSGNSWKCETWTINQDNCSFTVMVCGSTLEREMQMEVWYLLYDC